VSTTLELINNQRYFYFLEHQVQSSAIAMSCDWL
jgi:hypothetical protein